MPALPSSLALTTIADGASIIAADHRNNYASVQTAVNALIAAESGGTAGQFLTATSSTAVAWAGAYTNFTPTWTCTGTPPALGNGTIVSRYLQIGKFVHYYGLVSFGTTSTFGTGSFLFTLPVNSVLAVVRSNGSGDIFHSGTSARGVVTAEMVSASTFDFTFGATYLGTATPVSTLAPWTWATGDFISWNMSYEAA